MREDSSTSTADCWLIEIEKARDGSCWVIMSAHCLQKVNRHAMCASFFITHRFFIFNPNVGPRLRAIAFAGEPFWWNENISSAFYLTYIHMYPYIQDCKKPVLWYAGYALTSWCVAIVQIWWMICLCPYLVHGVCYQSKSWRRKFEKFL